MPYRKETFTNGALYHIYSRRPDGELLFREKRDRLRFLTSFFTANNIVSGAPYRLSTWDNSRMKAVLDTGDRLPEQWGLRSSPLVSFEAFILMPTHFHFLVEQKTKGGIQKVMQSSQNGYAKYFNTKYERKGPLFEGPFQAAHVSDDRYLRYLIGYIHLNALDTADITWRRAQLDASWKKVCSVLEDHLWSSYHYYMGQGVFGSLMDGDGIVHDLFPDPESFENHLRTWKAEEFMGLREIAQPQNN